MAPCEPTVSQLKSALADAQRGRLDREHQLHERIRRALARLDEMTHAPYCPGTDGLDCACGLDGTRAILRGEQ